MQDKKKQRIGIDLDGVIVDLTDIKIETAQEFGYKLLPRETPPLIMKQKIPQGIYKKIQKIIYGNQTLKANFIKKSLELIANLKNSGHQLFIISRRNQKSQKPAMLWLKRNRIFSYISPENIFFVKEDKDKEKIASKIRLDIFIDDSLDVLKELKSVPKKFLFDPFKVYKNISKEINQIGSWDEFMNKISRKIIVILGPTASGKSELAVKIAEKLNGEIISADSRQIYKGLNIGSGKLTKKEMRGIPHHCLDLVSPKKIFTVIDFKKCAEKAIEDILNRGKIPIICGGTGFYIGAITGDINIPEIKPDWKLRKKLEKKSTEQLFNTLKKLDPKRAKNIDPKNPRRLIRAIEIAKNSSTTVVEAEANDNGCRLLQIGIKLPEKELKKRIEKRVKKMLKRGLINEVKKLRKQGISWKRLYELGFEYKYPALFLQGKISKEEMLKRMILENWHYAKRQMTWFKRDKRIKWLRAHEESNLDQWFWRPSFCH